MISKYKIFQKYKWTKKQILCKIINNKSNIMGHFDSLILIKSILIIIILFIKINFYIKINSKSNIMGHFDFN